MKLFSCIIYAHMTLTHMTCCKGLISLLHHADLSFITGGSKAKFRYADDPSKVWVLRPSGPSRSTHSEALGNDHPWVSSVWEEDLLPRLRDPRTWQGCLLTDIDGEVSLVTGKVCLFHSKFHSFLRKNGHSKLSCTELAFTNKYFLARGK